MADKLNLSVGKGGQTVSFDHPQVGTLKVNMGLDDVSWAYRLYTVTYPTYGGEVVQILSSSIENITMGGMIMRYTDMIKIYGYFFKYFQVASQGRTGNEKAGIGKYNQETMKFAYPHRGWEFDIIPIAAPGFKIGRDVVVPVWRIQAHVQAYRDDLRDPKGSLTQLIESEEALTAKIGSGGDAGDLSFFTLSDGIGFVPASPWSDPFSPAVQDPWASSPDEVIQKAGEYYKQLLPAYAQGDFESILYGLGSGPTAGKSFTTKETKDGITKSEDAQTSIPAPKDK